MAYYTQTGQLKHKIMTKNKKAIILFIAIIAFSALMARIEYKATLNERLIPSGMLLLIGLIFLKFKEPIGRRMYSRHTKSFRDNFIVEEYTDAARFFGILLSSAGLITILIGLIFR